MKLPPYSRSLSTLTSFLFLLLPPQDDYIYNASNTSHRIHSPCNRFAMAWSPFPFNDRQGMRKAQSRRILRAKSISNVAVVLKPQPPHSLPSRRHLLRSLVVSSSSFLLLPSPPNVIASDVAPTQLQNFEYNPEWKGTSLQLLTPIQAFQFYFPSDRPDQFPMGRWPDPILRRPASVVPPSLMGTDELRSVASMLRRTAKENGAVGLAAQQCGIDASLIFLDDVPSSSLEDMLSSWLKRKTSSLSISRKDADTSKKSGGMFLVNPRIISRSPETSMKAWTEHCLVLPPTFSATVLRDDVITVEYETLDGQTTSTKLGGELARAAQHEMDHDRGILILDHVGLEELESNVMKEIEFDGHYERMELAYAREVSEARIYCGRSPQISSSPCNEKLNPMEVAREKMEVVPSANAAEYDEGTVTQQQDSVPTTPCNEVCQAERKKIIEDRRAMMKQSRTTTRRQDMFDLSRQRAALYNTTYQGSSCAPGIPCL